MRITLIALFAWAAGMASASAQNCLPRTINENGTIITVACDGNVPVYNVTTGDNKFHSERSAKRRIGELRHEDEQRAAKQAEAVATARKTQQNCIAALGSNISVAAARQACPLETAAPAAVSPETPATKPAMRSDRTGLRSDRALSKD